MTLTPASSLAPSSVTIAGTVQADVTDRAARLLGHVTVDNPSLPVTGPMTDAEFSAHLPLAVTGPLTAAELVAAEPLAVTGTLTTEGGATEATLERVADTLDDVGLTAILEREKVEE